MKRRNFLKTLFGAAGAAVIAPHVSGEFPDDVMWIQVIAPPGSVSRSCEGAGTELYAVEWFGKTWVVPQESGKIYTVNRSDVLGTTANKRYNSWNTGGYGVREVSSPFITPYDTGLGIPCSDDGVFNSVSDERGVVYQWWYEGGEELGEMENQLMWTDGVSRDGWGHGWNYYT